MYKLAVLRIISLVVDADREAFEKAMNFMDLPTDVFFVIFSQFLGLRELKCLSVVSRKCHDIAHRVTVFQTKYKWNQYEGIDEYDGIDKHSLARIIVNKDAQCVLAAWPFVRFVIYPTVFCDLDHLWDFANVIGLTNTSFRNNCQINFEFCKIATLTTLDLSHNNLHDDGAKDLAATLKVSTTLTILDLSDTQIGCPGAKDLAAALKVNATLKTLDLSDNKIGAPGAKELAEALKVNTTLTTLDLKYNEIGSSGVKEIAAARKVNTNCTILE